MARTAPVPNIPAIPGMNPGMFVAGGGAGGSGSGDGSGDGSGGDPNANGQNGGNDPNGDGQGAGHCGQGSGGGCPNPAHGGNGGTTAGDPVDALTGRVFTQPVRDVVLPGPLPLVVARTYSSSARDRDVGLGWGWTHTLASSIEIDRARMRVWREDGRYDDLAGMPIGEETLVAGRLLRRYEHELETFDAQRRTRVYREVVAGSGSYELVEIRDGFGNRIAIEHDARGVLTGFVDAVGRRGRVVRGAGGRIVAFEVADATTGATLRLCEYTHDDRGDLVSARNGCGDATRYVYGAEHELTQEITPTGRTTHWIYDRQARCVETWVAHPNGGDASIDAAAPKVLADGSTRAKGVLHCKLTFGRDGFVEVVTSREIRRYQANRFGKAAKAVTAGGQVSTSEFDRWGNLVAYADPLGHVWRWERDGNGRIVSEHDPLGGVVRNEYDDRGLLAERIDAIGRRLRYTYNTQGRLLARSDEIGPHVEMAYDGRGNVVSVTLPDGGITTMTYDAMGNRVGVVEPNGGARAIRYDFLGRIVESTDENGQRSRYDWDGAGRLVAVHDPSGGVVTMRYDADGHLVAMTTAAGRTWRLAWAGYEAVHEIQRPDGSRIRFRYDREGSLVRVINELGEEHVIARDAGGRVVQEKTFDGRVMRFRHDARGQLVRLTQPSGAHVDLEYDAVGNIVKRSWNDEIVEEFGYDLARRIVAAKDGATECTFEYDARSNCVREVQKVDGQERFVENAYDSAGRRVSKRTSMGHEEQVRFDVMSLPEEVALVGAGAPLRFTRDAAGAEIERVLPGGARVRLERDALGQMIRRRVYAAGGASMVKPGEPEWMGDLPGLVHDETFAYDPDGSLVQTWTKGRGTTEIAYDVLGRVLSRLPEHATREVFAYDAADNRRDGGRKYDTGGLLVEDARATYAYDADHRLIEKRVRTETGEEIWKYGWDARGMLAEVTRPDGARVHLRYDPFARLASKRVERRDGALARASSFVWDGRELVHEMTKELDRADDPIVEERTYAYVPRTFTPLAQRVVRRRAANVEQDEWAYFLDGSGHRPEVLLDDRGAVLARLDARVWGQAVPEAGARASTKLRYARHWDDEDTGLFYNLYRHYDATLGRYVSPEPLGLLGGIRPFNYAESNPYLFIDPNGLEGMCATASDGTTTGTGTAAGRSGPGGARVVGDLHPAVQACLLPPGASQEAAQNGRRHPASCAEPRAVSDYLDRTVGRPGTPAEISAALSRMHVEAHQENDGRPRAPCANCSQFFARMQATYGAPAGSQIEPGHTSATDNQPMTNFTPPTRPRLQQGAGAGTHPIYRTYPVP